VVKERKYGGEYMTNSTVSVKSANPCATQNFSVEDLKALNRIKKITGSGHNAEVKQKNGNLVVYDVEKTIAV